jgi:type IV pilus assembly protein PilM
MFEKKILGLDIGSKNIKIALVKQGKKPVVLKTVLAATPDNSVLDGELRFVEVVAQKIKSILTENKITASELYISLNSTNSVIREIKLPIMKASEIGPAVDFELSQSFPGVLQTHTISNRVYSAPNMPAEGITTFCPNKILDGYVALSKQLGIPLKAIDINANALTKAYNKFVAKEQVIETLMIVDLGHTSSQVNLVAAGKLVLSRQIPSGMVGLDNLVSNRMGISLEQAERARTNKKYDIYNLGKEDIDGFTRIVFSAVEEQIRHTIDYYRYNKAKDNNVTKIFLAGGGSLYAELASYLQEIFNIPVNELKPNFSDSKNESVSSMLMSAIGATLTDQDRENDINLIPRLKEMKAANGKTVKLTMLVAVVAAVAVLAVAAYTFLNMQTASFESEESVVQNEIIKYSVINKTVSSLKTSQDKLAKLTTVLEQYNAGILKNTELFDSISAVMPDTVFSINYNFTNENSISINGVSQDRINIVDFIYSLKQVKDISDAVISNISSRVGQDEKPIDYSFTLDIKLKR